VQFAVRHREVEHVPTVEPVVVELRVDVLDDLLVGAEEPPEAVVRELLVELDLVVPERLLVTGAGQPDRGAGEEGLDGAARGVLPAGVRPEEGVDRVPVAVPSHEAAASHVHGLSTQLDPSRVSAHEHVAEVRPDVGLEELDGVDLSGREDLVAGVAVGAGVLQFGGQRQVLILKGDREQRTQDDDLPGAIAQDAADLLEPLAEVLEARAELTAHPQPIRRPERVLELPGPLLGGCRLGELQFLVGSDDKALVGRGRRCGLLGNGNGGDQERSRGEEREEHRGPGLRGHGGQKDRARAPIEGPPSLNPVPRNATMEGSSSP
jgi:hypothetical protein